MLPGQQNFAQDFEFYLHAASLFKPSSAVTFEVLFTRLALSVAPPTVNTLELWYSVIKGLIDLARYDEAYAALMSAPYEKL